MCEERNLVAKPHELFSQTRTIRLVRRRDEEERSQCGERSVRSS
jgi:hypothetical protein